MSNWFSYQQLKNQFKFHKSLRGLLFNMFFSLIIILVGIWLNLFTLNYYDIHLLGKSQLSSNTQAFSAFHPSVMYWEEEILSWAVTFDLDPLLIATVMQIESCGDPHAVSPAGAQGLFQVMPYHFQSDEDMLDPQTNALRGLTYLQQSLSKSNGDVQLTLAGYNGGHGQIGRNPNQWPAETKRYVYWGSGIYQDALRNDDTGKALKEWLSAGGRYLCQQAANRWIYPEILF
jgi:soluble lytic murein transglycosylase-like protein